MKTQKRLEEQVLTLSRVQIETSEVETKISRLTDTIVTLEQEVLTKDTKIKTVT